VQQLLRIQGDVLSAHVLRGCQRRALAWPLLAWRGWTDAAVARRHQAATMGDHQLTATALAAYVPVHFHPALTLPRPPTMRAVRVAWVISTLKHHDGGSYEPSSHPPHP
jgi:hypothetical protein